MLSETYLGKAIPCPSLQLSVAKKIHFGSMYRTAQRFKFWAFFGPAGG